MSLNEALAQVWTAVIPKLSQLLHHQTRQIIFAHISWQIWPESIMVCCPREIDVNSHQIFSWHTCLSVFWKSNFHGAMKRKSSHFFWHSKENLIAFFCYQHAIFFLITDIKCLAIAILHKLNISFDCLRHSSDKQNPPDPDPVMTLTTI